MRMMRIWLSGGTLESAGSGILGSICRRQSVTATDRPPAVLLAIPGLVCEGEGGGEDSGTYPRGRGLAPFPPSHRKAIPPSPPRGWVPSRTHLDIPLGSLEGWSILKLCGGMG